MAGPLLGLLAMAGAAAAEPHYRNYQSRVRGQYQSGLLANIDQNDPAAVRGALFGGGLLSGPDFMGDVRGAFESEADRVAAMARQRVSSGPAYMQAQLAREKWIVERNRIEGTSQALIAEGMPEWAAGTALEDTWRDQYAANNPEFQLAGMGQTDINDRAMRLAAERAEAEQRLAEANLATDVAERTIADPYADVRNEYIETVQPLADQAANVDYALGAVDDNLFDATWRTSAQGLQTRDFLNRLMLQMRSDYWYNTLGRTDAPSIEEVRELQPLFPTAEGTWWDRRQAERMRAALRTYQEQIRRRRADAGRALTRAGQPLPQIEGRGDAEALIGAGWSFPDRENGGGSSAADRRASRRGR